MSGCTNDAEAVFTRFMRGQMLRVNALMIGDVILMGVIVGIGAYGHRYRHHPLTRFLFLGATILFLPIVSYIVSITSNQKIIAVITDKDHVVTGRCQTFRHIALVLIWTAFVQILGINAAAIVTADAREGRSFAPPAVFLVQAIWTTYLGVNILVVQNQFDFLDVLWTCFAIFSPFALIFAKIFFKYYAWYNSRQSFASGRNPRLIVGYMEQLPDIRHYISEQTPPPLIVSREDSMSIEKQPHGYRPCSGGDMRNKPGLMTIDKIWELDNMPLKSTTQLKDVCFSLALFKMLRCRFAKYTANEAGFMKARNFLWHVLLEDSDDKRILGVIESELSFLHDYYYSSLSISYSKKWLPILSMFISLLSIGYVLFTVVTRMINLSLIYGRAAGWETIRQEYVTRFARGQIRCRVSCTTTLPSLPRQPSPDPSDLPRIYGSLLFDVVPVLSLGALVVLSEMREIASYVCSDWTKVALMCRYISWQEYPTLRKWIGLLLQCRCKLVGPWQDKMNQCSILVLHPRKTPVALLRRLIPQLPEQKKNIKIPTEVKTAIVSTLRSTRGDLRNGIKSVQQLGIQIGDTFLRACNAKGTSDALLAWHIATSIVEARYPHSPASSDHEIVATHLSRYCAYLVAYSPELLPDDDAWSNGVYKAAKKDAQRVLAARVVMPTPEMEYRQLVKRLSTISKHDVLKDGAKLGEQLVELMEGEEAAWKALAGFWSEAILCIAPSDNLDGHAEAVARGGELITLLWALLTHLGVDRTPEAAAATTTVDVSIV